MKTRHLVTVLVLFILLLIGCAPVNVDLASSDQASTSSPASLPLPTPWPTGTVASGTPVSWPPIPDTITSSTTIATSPAAGWTRYISINQVYDLAFAPDGTLWAMTYAGLVHWDLATGTYTRYAIRADDLAVAQDGTLWLATHYGLCRFSDRGSTGDGATCQTYTESDGLISNAARVVTTAADGSVWVGTERGVSRLFNPTASTDDGASWASYPSPFSTNDLAVSANGDVWHATGGGVGRYNPTDDAWTTYTDEHGLPSSNNAQVIAVGPEGDVWTYILWEGLYHFDGQRWHAVAQAPGGDVRDIAVADDGTLWVGTIGGTHYPGGSLVFRAGDAWSDVTQTQGLTSIRAIALGPGDAVAAATNLGLGIYQGGKWRLLKDGPTHDNATSVAVTPDGATWFGFGNRDVTSPAGGLSRFDGQEWTYHLGDTEVSALAVAPDGALWVGTGSSVLRFGAPAASTGAADAWQVVGDCDTDFPSCGYALDIAFAPDGDVWVANGMSLAHYDGQSWTGFDKFAHFVEVGPDGAVWINGWEGQQGSSYVARWDGETWTTYYGADAFPGAFSVRAVTDDGRLWGFVPEQGLAAFNLQMAGAGDGQGWGDNASWAIYDIPAGWLTKAPDGALWINTDGGLARFDVAAEGLSAEAWTLFMTDDAVDIPTGPIAFGTGGEVWLGTTRFQPSQAGALGQAFTPTENASPRPAQPTSPAFATPTPAPIDQAGYPPETRTGVPVVDAIIDAVLADDLDAMRELVRYTVTGCTHADGLGGPPKCKADQAEGTLVEVFPVLGPGEGSYVRRESIDDTLPSGKATLYAVFRVSDDAYQEGSWPASVYGIVFRKHGEPFPALTVWADDNGIVRLNLGAVSSLEVSLERDVASYILPPLDRETMGAAPAGSVTGIPTQVPLPPTGFPTPSTATPTPLIGPTYTPLPPHTP